MRRKNRLFLVVSLLPLVLLGSAVAVVQAKDGESPAIKQELWSNPATWPDQKVPRAGDEVTIEREFGAAARSDRKRQTELLG
jgi:hypothetical protein